MPPERTPGALQGRQATISLLRPAPLPIGLLMAPPEIVAPAVLLERRLMLLAENLWPLSRLSHRNGLSMALRAVLSGFLGLVVIVAIGSTKGGVVDGAGVVAGTPGRA